MSKNTTDSPRINLLCIYKDNNDIGVNTQDIKYYKMLIEAARRNFDFQLVESSIKFSDNTMKKAFYLTCPKEQAINACMQLFFLERKMITRYSPFSQPDSHKIYYDCYGNEKISSSLYPICKINMTSQNDWFLAHRVQSNFQNELIKCSFKKDSRIQFNKIVQNSQIVLTKIKNNETKQEFLYVNLDTRPAIDFPLINYYGKDYQKGVLRIMGYLKDYELLPRELKDNATFINPWGFDNNGSCDLEIAYNSIPLNNDKIFVKRQNQIEDFELNDDKTIQGNEYVPTMTK